MEFNLEIQVLLKSPVLVLLILIWQQNLPGTEYFTLCSWLHFIAAFRSNIEGEKSL